MDNDMNNIISINQYQINNIKEFLDIVILINKE